MVNLTAVLVSGLPVVLGIIFELFMDSSRYYERLWHSLRVGMAKSRYVPETEMRVQDKMIRVLSGFILLFSYGLAIFGAGFLLIQKQELIIADLFFILGNLVLVNTVIFPLTRRGLKVLVSHHSELRFIGIVLAIALVLVAS